jgi:Ca-activated chloride channel family protein
VGRIPILILCVLSTLGALIAQTSTGPPSKVPQPTATSDDEVLRVETTLVTLPVSVLDRHGKLIRDLKREQFHIYENGVEQEIAYFEAPTEANNPLSSEAPQTFTVALLLDVSDSTAIKLEQIQRAALAFVNLLRPGDRVIVLSFDKRVQLLTAATIDRDAIHKAILGTRTGGGTSLYNAIEFVIRQQLAHAVGRKAVVLLTDGVDTSSGGVTADDALRAAEASDTVIYPIQYDTYGDFSDTTSRDTYGAGEFGKVAHVTKNGEPASEAYKRATLYLRMLADKTGGHFQYADSLKNLSRSFERLALKLREQYTLGYYPRNKSADNTPRQIKVEVAAPKITVRTRKSYVYKPRSR